MPGTEVVSGVICDYCAEPLEPLLLSACDPFEIRQIGLPADAEPQKWGIRRPTNYSIRLAGQLGATHVLRVIQDTYVDDCDAFCGNLGPWLDREDRWLGANLEYWATNYHFDICRRMGLPTRYELNYPQGAVLIAPLETWQRVYLAMPMEIHHHLDDVVMGVSAESMGIPLLNMPKTWSHLHHCDPAVSSDYYLRHLAELGE
jgi:hypothetical protein